MRFIATCCSTSLRHIVAKLRLATPFVKLRFTFKPSRPSSVTIARETEFHGVDSQALEAAQRRTSGVANPGGVAILSPQSCQLSARSAIFWHQVLSGSIQ